MFNSGGNLEFLGMRIDYVFNIPSILSFVSAFMLLYVWQLGFRKSIIGNSLGVLLLEVERLYFYILQEF